MAQALRRASKTMALGALLLSHGLAASANAGPQDFVCTLIRGKAGVFRQEVHLRLLVATAKAHFFSEASFDGPGAALTLYEEGMVLPPSLSARIRFDDQKPTFVQLADNYLVRVDFPIGMFRGEGSSLQVNRIDAESGDLVAAKYFCASVLIN